MRFARRAPALVGLLLLAGLPCPSWAAVPDDSRRQQWITKFTQAYRDVAEAQVRHEKAIEAFTRAKHRNRARGERRAELEREIAEAEAALAKAQERMRNLSEVARRAGVPPGWIRAARDSVPAAPSP